MPKNTDKSQDKLFEKINQAMISWHNIEVSSKPKTSCFCFGKDPPPHKIIKNVSGIVKPGTTLAIMGSSGAGKTTLLNVLTARNLSMFNVDGVVKINGQQADVQMITEMTAYVQQEDLFLPILTVREHLIFQAMVRMDCKIPVRIRAARIQSVMEELSLLKCADTKVGGGGSFKGISGGEMKRLAFAIEILTNPAIMFCDEPTSGLDAFMAHNLVSMIKRMADKGRTVICTIHQPSTDVFNLFSDLLLLADGRVAYMGKLSHAINYFSEHGFRCPPNYNPADFYVKELAIVPGNEFQSRNKINIICDYYLSSHPEGERFKRSSFLELEPRMKYKASIGQEFKALAWRSSLVALRQPMLLYIRLSQAIVIAFVLGLVYFRQEYNQYGVNNLNAALFLVLNNMTYQNSLAVVNTFCVELPIFMREHSNGMYRVAPYFICKNLAEFPVFVVIPISFVLIYFYMAGFTNESILNVLFIMFVAILTSSIAVGFGYFMSCACKNTDIALAIAPPLLIPFQMFGGFFVNPKNIPIYFQWARSLSWFRYGYELLMYNQWKDVKISCDVSSSKNSSLSTDENLETNTNSMCFADGNQVMNFYGIEKHRVFVNFLILLAYCFVFRIFAFIALWIRSRGR